MSTMAYENDIFAIFCQTKLNKNKNIFDFEPGRSPEIENPTTPALWSFLKKCPNRFTPNRFSRKFQGRASFRPNIIFEFLENMGY